MDRLYNIYRIGRDMFNIPQEEEKVFTTQFPKAVKLTPAEIKAQEEFEKRQYSQNPNEYFVPDMPEIENQLYQQSKQELQEKRNRTALLRDEPLGLSPENRIFDTIFPRPFNRPYTSDGITEPNLGEAYQKAPVGSAAMEQAIRDKYDRTKAEHDYIRSHESLGNQFDEARKFAKDEELSGITEKFLKKAEQEDAKKYADQVSKEIERISGDIDKLYEKPEIDLGYRAAVLERMGNPLAGTSANIVGKFKGVEPDIESGRNLEAARHLIDDARKTAASAKEQSGFFKALWDKLPSAESISSGGGLEIQDQATIHRVIKKVGEQGEESLTTSEKSLIDALAIKTITDAALHPNISEWAKIGESVGYSLPWMIEFLLAGGLVKTGLKGILKSISKASLKATRNLPRNAAGKLTKKLAAEVPNALVVGTAMSPLQSGTYSDILQRNMGQADATIDENGKVKYLGQENQKSIGRSIAEGLASSTISNVSEMSGELLGALGKFFKPGVKKIVGATTRHISPRLTGFISRTTPRVLDYTKMIKDKNIITGFRDFAKATGWNGFGGEVFEEFMDGTLNAITIGDQSLEDIYNWENARLTIATVGIMSVGMSSAARALRAGAKRKIKADYDRADRHLNEAFPPSQVARIKSILGENLEDQTRILGRMFSDAAKAPTAEERKQRSQEQAIIQDYIYKANLYEAYLGGLQSRIKEEAGRIIENLRQQANPDMGATIYADYRGQTVRITSGTFDIDPEGNITPREGSTGMLTIITPEGNTQVVSPSQLGKVQDYMTLDEQASTVEQQVEDAVLSQEESEINTLAPGTVVSVNKNGSPLRVIVTSQNADTVTGRIVDPYGKPVTGPDGQEQTLSFTLDEIQSYPEEESGAGESMQEYPEPENGVETAPVKEPSDNVRQNLPQTGTPIHIQGYDKPVTLLSVNGDKARIGLLYDNGEPMINTSGKQVTQEINTSQIIPVEPKEETSHSPQIPKDEKGTPLYEQAPEEATLEALQEIYPDDSELFEVIEKVISTANKKIEKLSKPKPTGDLYKDIENKKKSIAEIESLRQKADYWGRVLSRIPKQEKKKIFSERYEALGEDVSLEDHILKGIASGAYKFKWKGKNGLSQELGLKSEKERRSRIQILTKDGYTPETLAEKLWGEIEDGVHPFKAGDDMEIRNTIIDILHRVSSKTQALESAEELRADESRYYEGKEEEIRNSIDIESNEDIRSLYEEVMQEEIRQINEEEIEFEESMDEINDIIKQNRNFEQKQEHNVLPREETQQRRLPLDNRVSEMARSGNEEILRPDRTDDRSGERGPRTDERVAGQDRIYLQPQAESQTGLVRGNEADRGSIERENNGQQPVDDSGKIELGGNQSEVTKTIKDNGTRLEPNNDEQRQADGPRVADDTTRIVEGNRNRSDLRVFEEGLASSHSAYTYNSERNRRETESERLVSIAKQHKLFIPIAETKQLGEKILKRTGESVVYIDEETGKVYKVKDPYAKAGMKNGVEPEDAVFEHLVHNHLFPETAYTFEGISEEMGDVRIILSQNYIQSKSQPTQQQIAEVLASRGLFPEDRYTFGNDLVSVTDVEGDNVLSGEDGTVYFIDPIIRFKKPLREIIETLGSKEKPDNHVLGTGLDLGELDTLLYGPVPPGSLPPWERVAYAQKLKKELGSDITLYGWPDEVPADITRELPDIHKVQGFYDPKSGRMGIILHHTPDKRTIARVMMHEIVGHRGIRGLLGEQSYRFYEEVYASMPASLRESYTRRYGSRQEAADEYIADLAGRMYRENPFRQLWEELVALFRGSLRALGIKVKLNESDIRFILREARRQSRSGNLRYVHTSPGAVRSSGAPHRDEPGKSGTPGPGGTVPPSAEEPYHAVVSMLERAGIPVEILTEEEMQQLAKRGDAVLQARMNALEKAVRTIRGWRKNNVRGKSFTIDLPQRVKDEIRRVMGRDIDSHNITSDSLRHILRGHGESGRKLTDGSIPLRESDLELIPYIMTAPDRIIKGNTDITGREGIRFYKNLSNGYVLVVEREYKNSPNDMETITMWAEKSSAATNARSQKNAPDMLVRNAIRSTDIAKIQKDAEAAISGEEKLLYDKDGIIYGATAGGKIYLNGSTLNPETPIHEYTHLWDAACQNINPELWHRGVELMKQAPLWEQVKADPAYADLTTDNEIAGEVHSRLTGKDGAKLLEDIVSRSRDGNAIEVAKAVTLRERLKKWLKDFWWWLKDTLSPWTRAEAERVTIEDFVHMPLKDLVRGTDLKNGRMTAEESRIVERAKADGTFMNTGEYSPADNDIRFHIDTTIQADEQMERSHDADRQAISSMQSPVGVDTQGLSASEASQAVAGQKLINRKLDKDISRNIAFSSVNRLAVQSVYNKMWEPFWYRGLKKIPGLQKILPEKLNMRKAYEALFDSMTTLHDLIDDIEQKYGKLPEELNFYWAENASMSIVQDATDKFNEQYLQPFLDTLAKVRKAFENKDYMLKYYPLAKAGIERQLVQKERRIAEAKADPQYDGKPEKLQAAIDDINSRDFAGLKGTFQFMLREEYPQMQFPENFDKFEYEDLEQYAAENHLMNLFDFVKKSEDTLGRQLTNELWQRVRDISAYQLERKLQKGLISKDTYELLTYGTPMSEILKKNKNEEITKVNQTLTNKDEIDKAIDGIEKKYGIYIEGYFTPSQLLKKGLITQEQFDSLHRLYDFYVPMKGQTDVSAEDINEYERRERKNLSDLKKIKGHENMVRDPFTQLIQDTYGTIINGEQNAWKQRLLETCRRYSMPVYHLSETWLKKEKINGKEVFTPYLRKEEGITYLTPTQQEIDNGTAVKHRRGLDLDIPIIKAHEHEHAVTVFENGRPITIWFTDPAISRAVNKLNISAPIDNKFTQFAQKVQRFRAATMTTLNIAFTIPNVLKDYQEANANLLIKEGRKYQAQFNKYYWDKQLQSAVYRRLKGKSGDSEYDKLVDEYFRNGGPVAYTMLADYQKQFESLREGIEKAQKNKKLNSTGLIRGWLETSNKVAELKARVATYATSRQMGRSVTRSIWDSKEVSVNFDKKGTMSRTLGYWQLFWNAGRQSNRNQLQMIKDHPWRWLAVKSLTTSIGASEQALTILAAFLLGGDDDDAEKALDKYYSLTPYIRYSNFCFVAGDQVITIPLPPAFTPSHTLGVCMGEFVTRSNKPGYSTTNAFIDVASAAGKEWLPEFISDPIIAGLEGKDFKLSRVLTFQPIKPILEAYDNINFMDRPIYKDKANKNLPEYQRIYKGVPKGYIQISKWINDITGGNEIDRGRISPNPAAIEHVINGYVNGLGKLFEQTATMILNYQGGQNIPVLSRFWRGDVELYLDRDEKNSYYRLLNEAENYRYRRNAYRKDPVKYSKELEEINQKAPFYEYILKVKSSIDKLNASKQIVGEDEAQRFDDKIRELQQRIFEKELEFYKKEQ